jgi:hypothetical protein
MVIAIACLIIVCPPMVAFIAGRVQEDGWEWFWRMIS